MKIAIIGSGHIGATAARLFIEAGHDVALSNSRGPESLRGLVAELGSRAHGMTVADAVAFGEVVLIAIPFGTYTTLPAGPLAGKIVVNAMNYYPQRDGRFAELDAGRTTSSELVVRYLHGTRLVKAFNTIYFEHLATRGRKDRPIEDRHTIFVAGDDTEAKRTVSALIESIGFAAVDTGSLREGGRKQQPDSPIYNRPMSAAQARAALAEPS